MRFNWSFSLFVHTLVLLEIQFCFVIFVNAQFECSYVYQMWQLNLLKDIKFSKKFDFFNLIFLFHVHVIEVVRLFIPELNCEDALV